MKYIAINKHSNLVFTRPCLQTLVQHMLDSGLSLESFDFHELSDAFEVQIKVERKPKTTRKE